MTYYAEPGKVVPTIVGDRYMAMIRSRSSDGGTAYHGWWLGPTDGSGLAEHLEKLSGD